MERVGYVNVRHTIDARSYFVRTFEREWLPTEFALNILSPRLHLTAHVPLETFAQLVHMNA